MKVTVNPNIREPNKCEHVDLSKVLAHFKNSDKHGIEDLRALEDKEQQNKRKIELPAVVFGGTFETRNNKGLIEASGLMILDFDCESEAESEKIRDRIDRDEYIHAYFRSTRGLGWKALVRIPKVKDDSEYKLYWYAIEDYFPNVDSACKDIARACFYSYDPDLKYRPQSKVWDTKKNPNLQKASEKVSKSTNYSLVNRALNVIRRASVGERHNKILAAARLCGGWVASGKVDYQEAQRLLEQEAYQADPDDFKTNKRAITDGLDHGMRDPLDEDKFFAEERIEEKFDKIYWTLSDVTDELLAKYEDGLDEGYTVGYSEIDELYKLYLGYTTYIYGASFSGKSQIWFDFLKNLAFRYNMRHVVFSPETGDASDIYVKLIEMVAGADFYDTYKNKMDKDTFHKVKDFVDEHFIVVDPGTKSMTLDDLIASCEMIERVYNTKIHTLTIDPWNDLMHYMDDHNFREDKYLEQALRKLRVQAHFNNWHICVITHTRDQAFEGSGNKKYQPPATFREIAGGQAWSRRGFMMASVWRPPAWMEEYDDMRLDGNETFYIQQKYKPEWAGSRGVGILRYDTKKHCYYEGKGAIKKYAVLDKDKQSQQTYSEEVPF